MQCPNCKNQMEKGMMSGDSRHWMKEESFAGKTTKLMNAGFGLAVVIAWMCPNCGKVELQAEINK